MLLQEYLIPTDKQLMQYLPTFRKNWGCSEIAGILESEWMSRRMDTSSTQSMCKHFKIQRYFLNEKFFLDTQRLLLEGQFDDFSWNFDGKIALFVHRKTMIISCSVYMEDKNWFERTRMLRPCERIWWTTSIWMILHHFLIVHIWHISLRECKSNEGTFLNKIKNVWITVSTGSPEKFTGQSTAHAQTVLKHMFSDTAIW